MRRILSAVVLLMLALIAIMPAKAMRLKHVEAYPQPHHLGDDSADDDSDDASHHTPSNHSERHPHGQHEPE